MATKITPESIKAARKFYADNASACINDAVSGRVFVNDLPRYITRQAQNGADYLAGKSDNSFTMQQRALYIQTGECPALLP